MDLCSRRFLGMVVSWSMQTKTLIAALEQSCRVRKRLPENPVIFHSVQGSQYNAITLRTELVKRNIVQSMSGVGNCYDNAPMESTWARMKHELREEMMLTIFVLRDRSPIDGFICSTTGQGCTRR